MSVSGKETEIHAADRTADLKLDEVKAVFGDRFKVAYVRSSIIPGASSSLMIPANEPCPTQPHNHDALALDRGLQKYIVIEL